jgi:hypothetical protein
MRIPKTKKTVLRRLLPLLALMLCMGVFLCVGAVTAYAADINVDMESLAVDDVWLTGETLHIAVTDKNSGEQQTLELNLRDYAKASDEYVTVQAVDTSGRTSNIIQFKNPFYTAPVSADPGNTDNTGNPPAQNGGTSQSAVPDGSKPFTPGGTGTVMDNATDGDGKEFFTVKTEDGSVFYLIVDRQRNADNVYLLNAVTEQDLMALAEKNGKEINNGSTSAIPGTDQPGTTDGQNPPPTTQPDTKPSAGGGNNSMYIIIVIAVVAVGGAGYYFKIVKGKKNAPDDDEDETEDEYGYEDEPENDDYDGEGDDDE